MRQNQIAEISQLKINLDIVAVLLATALLPATRLAEERPPAGPGGWWRIKILKI
jgi:hypothetical protein